MNTQETPGRRAPSAVEGTHPLQSAVELMALSDTTQAKRLAVAKIDPEEPYSNVPCTD